MTRNVQAGGERDVSLWHCLLLRVVADLKSVWHCVLLRIFNAFPYAI